MIDFKILAIRPLSNCNPQYLKVLNINEFYCFYNDYAFKANPNDRDDVIVSYESVIPHNLFTPIKYDEKFSINIAAIVGKNGCGKSTLMELLYVAIYNLALQRKILKKRSGKKTRFLVKNINVEIYYKIDDDIYGLKITTEEVQTAKGYETITFLSKSIYKNNNEGLFEYDNITNKNDDIISDSFFYTIAVNYSIYSLNSKYIGDWIEPLFHKNDAYQTPIVINPMRTEGNININTENILVKQRMLANILEPVSNPQKSKINLRYLTKDKVADKLKLTFNNNKLEFYQDKNDLKNVANGDDAFIQLFKMYTGTIDNSIAGDEPVFVKTRVYVLYKLNKICSTYVRYREFIVNNSFVEIEELVKRVSKDSSHITFKIKQALNFLRYALYFDYKKTDDIVIGIEEFSNYIKKIIHDEKQKGGTLTTIELIPPSIFDISVLFESEGSFDDFSSGEKQKIHALNTIIYHLINVNSVFKNGESTKNIITKRYKYINIFFDEIELYFHPDLQRTFIKDLLEYIEKINKDLIDNIKGINILFATHSPFILSDIPTSNVMCLEIDQETKKAVQKNRISQTFGSNIHDPACS